MNGPEKNKTEQLRAKAGELAADGVLEDFSEHQDEIGRELAQLTASQNVESELAALKASLPSGKAQGELPPPDKEGQREDRP